MKRISFKQALFFLFLPIIIVIANISVCYANAPPPPTICVIVSNAPEDLELSVNTEKAHRTDRIFESYYTFYLEFADISYHTLEINTSDDKFEIALPQLQRYNNIFTLDLGSRTLTPGTYWYRPYQLASITLVLTLLIEGVIFFLFGYRKRASWAVFLVVNIVTQGLLYAWLNKEFYPLINSYPFPVFLSLIFGELLVFIIEIIAFLILVRERPRLITFLYVILANLASAIAGGFLINALI